MRDLSEFSNSIINRLNLEQRHSIFPISSMMTILLLDEKRGR